MPRTRTPAIGPRSPPFEPYHRIYSPLPRRYGRPPPFPPLLTTARITRSRAFLHPKTRRLRLLLVRRLLASSSRLGIVESSSLNEPAFFPISQAFPILLARVLLRVSLPIRICERAGWKSCLCLALPWSPLDCTSYPVNQASPYRPRVFGR
jgi:hypothetical protein